MGPQEGVGGPCKQDWQHPDSVPVPPPSIFSRMGRDVQASSGVPLPVTGNSEATPSAPRLSVAGIWERRPGAWKRLDQGSAGGSGGRGVDIPLRVEVTGTCFSTFLFLLSFLCFIKGNTKGKLRYLLKNVKVHFEREEKKQTRCCRDRGGGPPRPVWRGSWDSSSSPGTFESLKGAGAPGAPALSGRGTQSGRRRRHEIGRMWTAPRAQPGSPARGAGPQHGGRQARPGGRRLKRCGLWLWPQNHLQAHPSPCGPVGSCRKGAGQLHAPEPEEPALGCSGSEQCPRETVPSSEAALRGAGAEATPFPQ